jgi:hypothetical protein
MSEGSSASGDSRAEENFPGQVLPEGDVHAWYRRGMELPGPGNPAALIPRERVVLAGRVMPACRRMKVQIVPPASEEP